jgi:hypothetical protein
LGNVTTSVAELALRAVRAIEDDLGRLVVGVVRPPPRLEIGPPNRVALGANRDQLNVVALHDGGVFNGDADA